MIKLKSIEYQIGIENLFRKDYKCYFDGPKIFHVGSIPIIVQLISHFLVGCGRESFKILEVI